MLCVYIISSHATNLVTKELVMLRWTATGMLLLAVALSWYFARHNSTNPNYYRIFYYLLIMVNVIYGTFNIYTQRGMASKAVIMFTVPIILSAFLLSRVAIFTTAIISSVGYVLATTKYFYDYFNEGYTAELYIESAMYVGLFFVIATMLSMLTKFHRPEHSSGL